ARTAHAEMAASFDEMAAADNNASGGAPGPAGFPAVARRLAAMLQRTAGMQLAFMALGGWDTHVNQGSVQGQLAQRLKPLGEGLAALADGLGPVWHDTVILVVSEFGRTVHENGNGGTDHGHGNVLWALGGPIKGGAVLGDWPGLAPGALYQGRDLAVTTDFRAVLASVLSGHMRLGAGEVRTVLPAAPTQRFGGLLRT
ncbi:MAG: DUF1501 domain-containing protein, partial [Alphaproteobacteria bacterium]|nr:DUF1501 domain-containing protein [Alphaproteobacteria bacterium]